MAEQINDSQRPLRLVSPLVGELAVTRFSGTESLGRLFEFHVELIATDIDLAFKKIVGQNVTLHLQLEDESTRYFNGFMTEFRYVGGDARWSRYQAVIRPWLWFLTRTSDCRIFQDQTVPDIIKSVFSDNGMSDIDDRLTGSYREWGYCVQYRETDFNFISRLMEQEGIYYYFLHEDGKHTLVLSDDLSCHEPHFSPTVAYCPPSGEMSLQSKDHLQYWTLSQSMQSAKFAHEDWDFEKPKVKLLSKVEKVREFANPLPDPELYDYPGEYKIQGDGDAYIELRMQEMQSQHERVQAAGPCRNLTAGALVTLEDHPRADQNKEYLVVAVSHSASAGSFSSADPGSEELYSCQAELLDKAEPFRSARVTPKPVVQGCQTAMVVGPDSDEIYCDPYGRVKVQFHWDRYGTRDENSSCWIRVSQIWAGGNWGSMHIPRIGQEVIVSFLEGDPDQPIITGRVYNAESMPVYALEGNKTQSGIKSRSTPGGGANNFNEIRFEDKMGSEEVYIQAEKNEKIYVKNDKEETVDHNETITIGNDRVENVGHDETRTVGNNETVTIQNNRVDTVVMDETRSVLNNRTRTVAKNESVTVTLTRTHMVGVNESITVGGAQEITVGGMQTLTVAGIQEFSVGASRSVEVIGSQTEDFGRALNTQVGKDWAVDVGDDMAMKAGKKINIDGGDEIALKCGAASIVLKKSGDITISGKNIKLKANGSIDAKANATVKLKGATVKDN